MGVPRAHSTRGQKGRRRSHLRLTAKALVSCTHCQKPVLPHKVCSYCGYYGSKEVINVLGKELKKQEKKKQQNK